MWFIVVSDILLISQSYNDWNPKKSTHQYIFVGIYSIVFQVKEFLIPEIFVTFWPLLHISKIQTLNEKRLMRTFWENLRQSQIKWV